MISFQGQKIRRSGLRLCGMALAALFLVSCSKEQTAAKKEDEDKAEVGVALTADQVKALGVETVNAAPAEFRRDVTGFGVVSSLDTIAQADADTQTAAAAAGQSAAAAARARSLGTGDEAAVSREVVEAAESKAAADQASLALARRKADSIFGIHAPWQTESERAAIMARLTSGRTALVRVTFPMGSLPGGVPGSMTITRLGVQGQTWRASTVWEAPADPNLPGRTFFALLDGSDLAQNEHVTAGVPVGAAQQGLKIPAAAVVMSDGENWVYLQNGDHYVRTRISTANPLADGYFEPSGNGISSGQKIVTRGAGLILSREINPNTASDD